MRVPHPGITAPEQLRNCPLLLRARGMPLHTLRPSSLTHLSTHPTTISPGDFAGSCGRQRTRPQGREGERRRGRSGEREGIEEGKQRREGGRRRGKEKKKREREKRERRKERKYREEEGEQKGKWRAEGKGEEGEETEEGRRGRAGKRREGRGQSVVGRRKSRWGESALRLLRTKSMGSPATRRACGPDTEGTEISNRGVPSSLSMDWYWYQSVAC